MNKSEKSPLGKFCLKSS